MERESAAHLLLKSRYSARIFWHGPDWEDTAAWTNLEMVKDWWLGFIFVNGLRK
jgi:hypothetical protein